jgi:hypothetical protein
MADVSESEFRADVEDQTVHLQGGGLGAAFQLTDGRWTEAICAAEPGFGLVRALVLEASDSRRVVNPVYQEIQLHGERAGSSLCVLLTGLSFDHHFSAAVTLSADPQYRGSVRLDFDVADRCRSPVESLAATYLVSLDSNFLEMADIHRIAWRVDAPDPGRLELLAGPDAFLAMAEAGRNATRVKILARIDPTMFTHRLRYGWRWTSCCARSR